MQVKFQIISPKVSKWVVLGFFLFPHFLAYVFRLVHAFELFFILLSLSPAPQALLNIIYFSSKVNRSGRRIICYETKNSYFLPPKVMLLNTYCICRPSLVALSQNWWLILPVCSACYSGKENIDFIFILWQLNLFGFSQNYL